MCDKINPMKTFIKQLFTLVIAFSLALTVSYAYGAWSEPSGNPPSNNTETPINISATTQTKAGNFNAKVIGVDGLCLGTDCRTAWPTGGGSAGTLDCYSSPVTKTAVLSCNPGYMMTQCGLKAEDETVYPTADGNSCTTGKEDNIWIRCCRVI